MSSGPHRIHLDWPRSFVACWWSLLFYTLSMPGQATTPVRDPSRSSSDPTRLCRASLATSRDFAATRVTHVHSVGTTRTDDGERGARVGTLTTRRIEADEEVLVDYGEAYWEARR